VRLRGFVPTGRAALILAALGLLLGMVIAGALGGGRADVRPPVAPGGIRPPAILVDPSARVVLAARPVTVVAADGHIWVANGDHVDRIDPSTGTVVATIRAGGGRSGVAAGEAGIWFSDMSTGIVAQIDPLTNRLGASVDVPNPEFLAVGVNDVWVASPTSGEVTRIDARSGSVVATIEVGAGPSRLAVTTDAIWVPHDHGVLQSPAGTSGMVSRIDPGADRVVTAVHAPNASGGFVYARKALVDDGAVWVADSGGGAVYAIDTATNAVRLTIPVGPNVEDMTIIDGSLWVTVNPDGEDSLLVRIDPELGAVQAAVAVHGASAGTRGLTGLTGLDGRLWVGADWSDGSAVVAIDPP
jgi:YVTN family beta-propeller protein